MYLAGAVYAGNVGYNDQDTFLPLSLPALDAYTAPSGYLPSVVTPTTARWTTAGSGTGEISAGSGAWGSGSNWFGGIVPNDVLTNGQVTTCASVLFDGFAGLQHSITLSSTQAVTSLTFNLTPSTTSGFTFFGNSLTLGEAGLTNNDIHTQTFNNAIILRTSQQWHAGVGGLTISASGSLDLGSGNLLYLDGSGTNNFQRPRQRSGQRHRQRRQRHAHPGQCQQQFFRTDLRPQRHAPIWLDPVRGRRQQRPGAPTGVASGTIYLAGTLAYVGSGSSSDRIIDIADGPGAAEPRASSMPGSGPLYLSGGVTCENVSGTSLLALQGSGSGSQSGASSTRAARPT